MQISVIIVNYNSKHFTEQCLCSVAAAMKHAIAEVWVVDNASEDNSLTYLKPRFPWVQWIASDENLGFAKANNLALEKVSGQYVLFLNPDTIIPEHCLTDCLHFMETHSEAGAVGLQMIDGSGVFLPESKRALPSPSVSFWKLTGLAAVFPNSPFFNQYALGHLPKQKSYPVPVLSGAYMFCRTSIIRNLGGFDEIFFMYGEDIDLSYRITLAGYQNYYLGSLSIIHFKGESSPIKDLKYVRLFYKAMQQFVHKHYKGPKASVLKLMLHIAIVFRGVIAAIMLLLEQVCKQFQEQNKKASAISRDSFILTGDALTRDTAHLILKSNNKTVIQEADHLNTSFKAGTNIVFCAGLLTYSECISFCGQHHQHYVYYWHSLSAACVVGSPSKNQTGVIYTLPNNY